MININLHGMTNKPSLYHPVIVRIHLKTFSKHRYRSRRFMRKKVIVIAGNKINSVHLKVTLELLKSVIREFTVLMYIARFYCIALGNTATTFQR